MQLLNLNQMKDSEILDRFSRIVKNERETTALLILHLSEIDKRGLYAKEGFSSLFSYCVEKFHFSEEAAYRRIQAARLSQKFPQILGLLEEGKINLTTINLISPHLTADNKDQLLKEIQFKSKRGVEKIIATHFPPADHGKDIIRRLPLRMEKAMPTLFLTPDNPSEKDKCLKNREEENRDTPMVLKKETEESHEVTFAGEGSLPNLKAALPYMASVPVSNVNQRTFQSTKHLDEIKPIAANRVKIEFRADEPVAEMIERARQLLRHKYPHGRLEDIFREILELFLEKKDPGRSLKRKGISKGNGRAVCLEEKKEPQSRETLERKKTLKEKELTQPHVSTRYISQTMKLEIWKRDGGQCTFVSKDGIRCIEKGMLEFDHVEPWAWGGRSTLENLRLLCRTHNQWRARQTFGSSIHSVGC